MIVFGSRREPVEEWRPREREYVALTCELCGWSVETVTYDRLRLSRIEENAYSLIMRAFHHRETCR